MIATAIPNAMAAVNINPFTDAESQLRLNEAPSSGIQKPSASCVPEPQASPPATSATSSATASAASTTSSATASAASTTSSAASTTSSIAAALLNAKLVEALFMSQLAVTV